MGREFGITSPEKQISAQAQKWKNTKGNHQRISQALPPTQLGGAAGALQIVGELARLHVFSITGVITDEVDRAHCLALPTARARWKPARQKSAEGANIFLSIFRRVGRSSVGTKDRLQVSAYEN